MTLGDVEVIVLAAGAGRRLGAGPKAHVRLGAETLLSRVVRSARGAGLEEIRVVGGAADPSIAGACAALDVVLAQNPEPERGMFSSVQVALRASARSVGAIIFPVDVPLVETSTVASLARALASAGADAWVRPVHAGRRGHPIGLGAGLLAPLLELDPVTPLRDALVAVGARPLDVPSADAGVVLDIDTPDDLAAARTKLAARQHPSRRRGAP